MLRIYIGFQAIKFHCFLPPHFYCFSSTTTTTTFLLFSPTTNTAAATFLLFSLHHHHISIVSLHHHYHLRHHITIVFYPSPTRFIFFPPRDSIKDCQLPSLVHFVAMSRVVNNNRGSLQLLAYYPAHQRQLLLKRATPQ